MLISFSFAFAGFDKVSTINSIDGQHGVTLEVVTLCSSEASDVFRVELSLYIERDPSIRTRRTIWLVDGDESRISIIRSLLGDMASVHLCVHHLFDNFVKHTSSVHKAEADVARGVPIGEMTKSTLVNELRALEKTGLSNLKVDDLRKLLTEARQAATVEQPRRMRSQEERPENAQDDMDDDNEVAGLIAQDTTPECT